MMTPGTSGAKSEVIQDEGQGSTSLEDTWAIRSCFLYKEEYDDCNSFKARFNQYFIHGQSTDCTQWKQDYENCIIYEESKAVKAGEEIVASEARRRQARLKAHYANDVWKKRSAPPSDWDKPLPEWLIKKNENTFLDIKAKEADVGQSAERTMCCIM